MLLKNFIHIIYCLFLIKINIVNSSYNKVNYLQRDYSSYNIIRTLDCNETLPIINDYFYNNENRIVTNGYSSKYSQFNHSGMII